ncbi:HSP90 family protein [Kitasatospora sp. MAP5-34]|uniref:HSP90 family protein n=1 Tax=Kitasatospora sp. MAP5-34 TaxID=3035102 RepID=UPI0024768581|nr:HSP90 family protein [Kitasatospora sp. MAP5-34]MDH6575384.1 molecular chaperone HtpG [Kitasatospora sp. MAP5-34]
MSESFRVDLRGIVDLLSHHLYTSPQVYSRELLQNAVDAITAVHLGRPEHEGRISITSGELTGDGSLRVDDNGIGLGEQQVHELLATIGRSSKRDELGFARHEFIGQFGIGLLSCFMVSDEIRVRTRRADEPTVLWHGRSDGSYSVELAPADEQRSEPGTTVTLHPRPGSEQLLTRAAITQLAGHYGSQLPFPVTVDGAELSSGPAPWSRPEDESGATRRVRLEQYCEAVFGFTPFDVIDISAAEAGLRGVAFVLPMPANPAVPAAHRVYLKQMLLAEGAEGLLPDWAFFVRCVVDTTELRPTASREALYEDSLLEETREALGDKLRGWLMRLATGDPARLRTFLRVHHLGVKALALHDDQMLRLVEEFWPMESNVGPLTLAEFRARYGLLRFTPQLDEFRQLAPVAAAQGLAVLNAGYVYDRELIDRVATLDRELVVEPLRAADLTTHLERIGLAEESTLGPFLAVADRVLGRLGCDVLVRSFEPVGLPALYLLDEDTAFQLDVRNTREQVDETWAAILGGFQTVAEPRPRLILNHRSALVRQVLGLGDPELTGLCLEGLYVQALLLGHHPLRPADTAVLNQSFLGLIGRAVAAGGTE